MEGLLLLPSGLDQIVSALGWTVLHSFWQASLIAFLLGLLHVFYKDGSARFRYYSNYLGLVLILVWAGFTFFSLTEGSMSKVNTGAVNEILVLEGDMPVVEMSILHRGLSFFTDYFEGHLPLIVSLWLLGMVFFMLRFLGGLIYVRQLRNRQLMEVPAWCQEMMQDIQSRLGLKKVVQLYESARVKVPMCIGTLRPVILMPVGALMSLSPAQVEAILAHELAHIQRNDYWLNLVQSLIEVLFYFNPAVWWVSAQIRVERENCCDDIAVELCQNDLEYARALLGLQEISKGSPALAIAFSGRKNHLLNRVHRILNHPTNKNNIMEKLAITSVVLLSLALLTTSATGPFEKETKLVSVQLESIPEMEEISLLPRPSAPEKIMVKFNSLDTIPPGKVNVQLTKNGKKIEAKLENGKILQLKVDGELQPASKYAEYLPMLQDVMVAPPPPPVMAPPPPPVMGAPAPPAPPTPPSPPNAPVFKVSKKVKVKTDADGEGNTMIWINSDDSDLPMEFKIDSDKGGAIFLNGAELLDGEETIIIDQDQILEFVPGAFNFRTEGMEFKNDFEFEWVDSMASGQMKNMIFKMEGAELARMQEASELMKERSVRLAERANSKYAVIVERLAEQESLSEEKREKLEEALARIKEVESVELQEQLKKMEQNVFIFKEQAEGQREAAEKEMEVARFYVERKSMNVDQSLQRALLSDGLIKSSENFSFKLTDKMLKIDGKKQSKITHEKYLRLYEEISGNALKKNMEVSIKKSKN